MLSFRFYTKIVGPEFPIKAVIGLCTTRNKNDSFLWAISLHRQHICFKVNKERDELANQHTLTPNIVAMADCPQDMNK